VRIDA